MGIKSATSFLHRVYSNVLEKVGSGRSISIAPLVTFRFVFGCLIFASSLRFMSKGWISELYLEPVYFFTWKGLEWVQPLGATGMYGLYILMATAALGVAVGYRYRLSATLLFLTFTYCELIDKTNYLNHYYFVSLVAFLMILLPANRSHSFDVLAGRATKADRVPLWVVGSLRLQLGVVYFFAGLAKLNSDWLLQALPLKIWLPAKAHLPVIGSLLSLEETAYLFSWGGAVYDLSIPFLLLWSRSRPYAFAGVIAFHLLTALLFPIGVFPWVMIGCSLVFFSGKEHEKWQAWLGNSHKLGRYLTAKFSILSLPTSVSSVLPAHLTVPISFHSRQKIISTLLAAFFLLQIAIPLRHHLYHGNLFWTEQGYRFSWRVMLMEKAGAVWYRVSEKQQPSSARELGKQERPEQEWQAQERHAQSCQAQEWLVYPSDYLTPLQEKMMATQPDMILQFAHFLEKEYAAKGIKHIEIRAESFVSLNGRGSRAFIDPEVNLLEVRRDFRPKDWILPSDYYTDQIARQ